MATALPGTGVPVSTDILTTLNGVAATANEAIQRIKVSTGAPGTATDVSLTNTFPVGVIQPDVNVTGTITTTDIVVAAPGGTGVPVSGASTVGSYVVAAITGGYTAWVAQVTGLTTGTLYFELSADSTNGIDGNWINVIGRQTGILNSTLTNSATVNGNWRGNLSSYKYMRLRSVGVLTGTPAILIRMSAGVATVFLNGSLPTGSNVIGAQNVNTATASAVTVMQNAVAVTGPGVSLPVTGYGTTVLQVTGVFVASIAFEASVDAGVSWVAISATQIGAGDIFNVATVPGVYRITSAGMDLIRARVTWTSGTSITINGRATNAVNASKIVKLATGGLTIGALVANQSVNKAQINGVVPLMGNGVSGTGSQRVNIASDNTAFPVNATLTAETTKVIGTVNLSAAQTLATVTTVSAVTAITNALPTGANTIGTVNQGTANAAAWLANPLTSQITAETSSAKIATGNSAATITNPSAKGVMLFLNASVVSGTTPSLTVRVQVLDPVSAAWVDLPGATYAAVVAATATPLLLVINTGVVAVANSAVNMPLPRSWRLAWVISGTTPSFTFSVGAQYLV